MAEIALTPSASFAFHDIYAEQGEVLGPLARGKLQKQKLITQPLPARPDQRRVRVVQDKHRTGAVFVALTI